jgi:hypothetical protein
MHPLLDDIAPNTYASLVNSHQRAMDFVRSKLPADRDALFAGEAVLAQSEKIRLDRYAHGAFYPATLLHEMADGNVRPETVEAVRVVYPELYSQVQKAISETLADSTLQRKLDRRKKFELSKVLGIATTESLQHIDMLQGAWEQEEAPAPSVKPPNTANFMAPSEAIQSRMRS